MELWAQLEAGMISMAHDHSLTGAQGRSVKWAAEYLRGDNLLSTEDKKEFQALRQLRNQVVHGKSDHRTAITPGHHRAPEGFGRPISRRSVEV